MTRRKFFEAASSDATAHRKAMVPLCQRFTRRVRSRSAEWLLSIRFVDPRQRLRDEGRPRRGNREPLPEAPPERCHRTGPVPLEPRRVLLDLLHARIRVEFPGRLECGPILIVLLLRQMAEHVAEFAIAAAPDGVVFSEDLVDRLMKSLRSVYHE